MGEHIVGMMWNCNEADILPETIEAALSKVDSLFIADDGSTDNSWEIIKGFAERRKDKIEYIRNKRELHNDKGQRLSMLNEIKCRYKPENTWVQIIESDIMIIDPDIRETIKKHAVGNLAVSWMTLNAAREKGTWDEVDKYPNWDAPITEIMPYAHWMEVMLYTFRPLPKVTYDLDRWRPWPQGFSHYTSGPVENKRRKLDAPLLAHYGYRGPTHFYEKFKNTPGGFHPKYKHWDLRSRQGVQDTVSFFNGHWNNNLFDMSREGWIKWRKG